MKHVKTFKSFLNEGKKNPVYVSYVFLANLSPEDHDSAVEELKDAGIEYNFKDAFDEKRGFITVDKNTLSSEQTALLEKWKRAGDAFMRQRPTYNSKNPKEIEKFIDELPDTTESIKVPDRPGDFVGSQEFSPKKDGSNWKDKAVKHMYNALKGKGGEEVYQIDFASFTGGGIRGYASWYVRFRTEKSDEFGQKMASGYYGSLD